MSSSERLCLRVCIRMSVPAFVLEEGMTAFRNSLGSWCLSRTCAYRAAQMHLLKTTASMLNSCHDVPDRGIIKLGRNRYSCLSAPQTSP